MIDIAPGQLWLSHDGPAEVLAIVHARQRGDFAVMQRTEPRPSNPFIVPLKSIESGFDGWHKCSTSR